jgi:hypothetical protein
MLLDDLVCAAEQREGHGYTKSFGRLQIHDQFDGGGLLDREVGRLRTLEDSASIDTGPAIGFFDVSAGRCGGLLPQLRMPDLGHRQWLNQTPAEKVAESVAEIS